MVAEKNNDGQTYFLYTGKSGISGSGELDFDNYIKLTPSFFKNWLKMDTYIFSDAGTMGYQNSTNKFFLGKVRIDAGIGMAATIKKMGTAGKNKTIHPAR